MDSYHEKTHSFANFPKVGRFLAEEWADHILKRLNKRIKRLDECVDIPAGVDFFPVDYVTGADIFVKRSIIDKYGGFDKEFFMYYEESEMQYRWRKEGELQSYILKGPQIIHLEGKSQSGLSVSKYLIQLKSQMLYFKITCPQHIYYIYRVFFLIGRLITLPFQNFDKKQRKEYLDIIFKF